MFDPAAAGLDVEALAGLCGALAGLEQGVDDTVRVDRIRLLEDLKSAAAAAQARETAAFAASQRAEQRALGVPAERVGRGIAAQVGLARRISPFHAARYVGWSSILTTELPATFTALAEGRVSEWRAMLVARETAWLSREHRAQVDAELAPKLATLGDRRVEAEAKKLAYRLDPSGYLNRIRGAESDRHVGLRPAPDAMGRLTILTPIAQTVASYAELGRDADARIAAGDPRSRGQIMADTAIERLTGQTSAAAVPIEINLIMTDQTLLNTGPNPNEPAHLDGYGPIPARIARDLALGNRPHAETGARIGADTGADTGIGTGIGTGAGLAAPRWLRRLYTHPDTGQLVAMETRRRCFTPAQRHYIQLRDQYCRTPWCEAPIRHTDHITPAETSGPTHTDNGQGYCQACNHTKQAPGWTNTRTPGPVHEVEITTPTGHHYRSQPPDPPGVVPRATNSAAA